jgi:TRAP-type mannitol/chloroaromatic compound transport system permease small subunit
MRSIYLIVGTLVVPLALLLFAQWPLRDLFHAYSREANDLAQILFAIYVAIAITAATRADAHLGKTDTSDKTLSARNTRWFRLTLFACVAPWSLFVLYAYAPQILSSIASLEHFSETGNPGYFLVKVAAWLLALFTFFEAVVGMFRKK